jgi:hypothetical protein
MDYEDGFIYLDTPYNASEIGTASRSTFVWNNVGENALLSFAVVQIGNTLYFHDRTKDPMSVTLLGSVSIVGMVRSVSMEFTVVDGNLLAVNGDGNIYTVTYDPVGESFSLTSARLLVRDTFGVSDFDGGVDLTDSNHISDRPSTTPITDNHLYNLRNQSWGVPRAIKGVADGTIGDPLQRFHDDNTYGKWPSNADNQNQHYRPDPEDNIQEERFFPTDAQKQPPYHLPAAKGYFIIDALDRGASRQLEHDENFTKYTGELVTDMVGTLPLDSTPGGATEIAEFAGRVFYGGFSGEVADGDEKSPRLSSYLMFSRLVDKPTDIVECYQEGDPTGPDTSDLVATDGGILRISGMEQVLKLISLESGLFVIASNGVWRIIGGNDTGFDATNFLVTKVARQGATNSQSVVEVENTIYYWTDDGIYHLAPNERGFWNATNLTQTTIQSFYNGIEDKFSVTGTFDEQTRRIHWLYADGVGKSELVLDTVFQAFLPMRFVPLPTQTPELVSHINVVPFAAESVFEEVLVGTDSVLSAGDVVVAGSEPAIASVSQQTKYVTLFDTGDTFVKYTFSALIDPGFVDWRKADPRGTGNDAEAYMLAAEMTGGDSSIRKQATYLTFHMKQTEENFDANFTPDKQSSCLVRAQWDFSNSAAGGNWGREFEAYKLPRHLMTDTADVPFDDGQYIITTKNKLRGRGRSVAVHMRTQPGKQCKIVGWNLALTGNPHV